MPTVVWDSALRPQKLGRGRGSVSLVSLTRYYLNRRKAVSRNVHFIFTMELGMYEYSTLSFNVSMMEPCI